MCDAKLRFEDHDYSESLEVSRFDSGISIGGDGSAKACLLTPIRGLCLVEGCGTLFATIFRGIFFLDRHFEAVLD